MGDEVEAIARGLTKAQAGYLWTPPEEAWGGLARQIIFWMDMEPRTPRALFKHLERSGYAIPDWLRKEPEMRGLDHVPSKGTRAVLVYRAMLDEVLPELRRHLEGVAP